MRKKDYYKVLGVSEEATTGEIKKAYKKLARKYHPDLHPGDKSMEAKFKEINEAQSVLTDPKKRADYDYAGKEVFEPVMGGPFNAGGRGGFSMGGMGGIEDLFSAMFEGRGGPAPPRRGTDIESAMEIDFMQAALGSEFKITVTRGKKREKITVKIPAGVDDGSKVKLKGKGNPGVKGAGAGDLYIVTRVKSHPYFSRKGSKIYLDVPITIKEALLGALITVPTLTGTTTVKVPPGTKGGQKLRLKKEGVKGVKGQGRGDMYLNIMISVPKPINKRSRELIEEFSKINTYEPRSGLW